MYVFPLVFFRYHICMDKFIIMNVHHTTPKKTPQIILKFFPFFLFGVRKNIPCLKND